LLSKIESGKVSSPISTLAVIAKALGTSFEKLLTDEEKPGDAHESSVEISIVRKNEREHYDVTHNGAISVYEWLALGVENRQMEPFIITIPKENVPTMYSHHPGQEMIFVLQGKVLLSFRRQNYLLEEGDSAFYDATVAHRIRSAGEVELKLLCVRSIF
jgi:mannose-6-phosphate isomerase-like protein (cupin superfamily)